MLISTVFLVATQLINACLSTRLPMGVSELKYSNGRREALATAADLIPETSEYAETTSHDASSHTKEHKKSSHNVGYKTSEQQQLDRRRRNAASSGNVHTFYKVGSSEDDLDICQPNQVCSKINLYQAPWIERHCRCPSTEIRHHHDSVPLRDAFLIENDFLGLMTGFVEHLGSVYQGGLHEGKVALASNEDNEFRHLLQKRQSPHIRHSRHTHRQENIEYTNGCSTSLMEDDGHTIVDKTRLYKLCDHTYSLPTCQFFYEPTWTVTISQVTNITKQIVHCICPENSVAYLLKRAPTEDGHNGFTYSFACSPVTNYKCQRKHPCKLFTVQTVRDSVEEVNINSLCECPSELHCPIHHNETGVISGDSFMKDKVQTYSAYCTEND